MRRLSLALIFPWAIFSGAALAQMQQSPSVVVGDLPEPSPETLHECHADRVMTGIEVRYAPNGIGQIRGVCREWAPGPYSHADASILPGGTWVGWSDVSDPSQYSKVKSLHCGGHRVIRGFFASGDNDNLHKLMIVCDNLNTLGEQAGKPESIQDTAGVGDQPMQGPLWCPPPSVSQGFYTSSNNRLLRFGLMCGEAEAATSYDQTYNIDGNDLFEMINLAGRNRGLGFRCQMLPESTRGTTCRFAMHDGPPRMEIEFPHNGSPFIGGPPMTARAAFRFFTSVPSQNETDDLAARWRVAAIEFRRLDVEGDDDPLAACEQQVANDFDEGDPYYEVSMVCGSMTSLYTVQYEITRVALIGPDGQQWEDAFATPTQ